MADTDLPGAPAPGQLGSHDGVPRPGEDFTMMTWPVPGAMVLSLGGELDLAAASLLLGRVQALVEQGHRRIVLDLAHLGFCDCSGLRALLRAREIATESGGWARLSRVGGLIRRVIELTALGQALECYDSALSAVGAPLTPWPDTKA
jgi:anti-sigma B factor antagonist